MTQNINHATAVSSAFDSWVQIGEQKMLLVDLLDASGKEPCKLLYGLASHTPQNFTAVREK